MKAKHLEPCKVCGVLGSRKCIYCLRYTCVKHGAQERWAWVCVGCAELVW